MRLVVLGLVWDSYEDIPWPPFFSYKGVYNMTSNMPSEERSGEGLNHMTSDMKG